jgi:hypothetical protein
MTTERPGSAGKQVSRFKPTLPDQLPPLRMLLVMDNLAGHLTASFMMRLFEHGIMPL